MRAKREVGRGRGCLGCIAYRTVRQWWGFTEEIRLEFPFGCRCGLDDSIRDPFEPFVACCQLRSPKLDICERTIVDIGPDPWSQ